MNLRLLAEAPVVVQLHLLTVVPAAVIGGWLIARSIKGSPPHRAWGKAYMVLMLATAVISVFIHELNPGGFSLLHLVVPLTIYGIWAGWHAIRGGDARGHRRIMAIVYITAILLAGGFTLTPGRLLHDVFFT